MFTSDRSLVRSEATLLDSFDVDDLDILCLTEPWVSSEDTVPATGVTPCGYLVEHVARSNRRGGGVGVLFRASYTVDHSTLWPGSSFECFHLQLHSHRVSSTTVRHLSTAIGQPQLPAIHHLPRRVSRPRRMHRNEVWYHRRRLQHAVRRQH